MFSNRNRSITPSKGGGFFQDLAVRIKLILRLMSDARVSPWLKVLPLGSLIYLIVPDIAPGPLDDAAVIWLGTYLFVELCPPEVVQEHLRALTQEIPGEYRDPLANEDEIIDAEFTEEEKS
ncbi:MAG TPA: hypothetical protein VIS10_05510 [Anaerolineales bacterium]